MELEELCQIAGKCIQCPLHESRTKVVFGEGPNDSNIMFIGEAPGKKEDETGRPFVGRSGQLLDQLINEVGINRFEVYITSIVKCRPPANRKPRKLEYDTCIDLYLNQQIKLIRPEIIVLLGNSAIYALIGRKDIKKIHGNIYELKNRKFMAMFHPAAALYNQALLPQLRGDMANLKKIINL
jgi:uracil-DNA glycosylase family 4